MRSWHRFRTTAWYGLPWNWPLRSAPENSSVSRGKPFMAFQATSQHGACFSDVKLPRSYLCELMRLARALIRSSSRGLSRAFQRSKQITLIQNSLPLSCFPVCEAWVCSNFSRRQERSLTDNWTCSHGLLHRPAFRLIAEAKTKTMHAGRPDTPCNDLRVNRM